MQRFAPTFAAALVVAGGLAAFGIADRAHAAQPNADVTVKIALPPSPQLFKDGPGAQLARTDCQVCHSSQYVYTQPPFTKEQWLGEIKKMKAVYGAQFSDADIEPIADYLTAQNGKP